MLKKKNQIKVALTSCDKKKWYMRQCKKKLYISDDALFFFPLYAQNISLFGECTKILKFK
jgi:hypothetical protein